MKRLSSEYSAGYISVPCFGAGTANTEFEVQTGINLDDFGPGEYPYKTVLQSAICESAAYDLKNLGYSTHALHIMTEHSITAIRFFHILDMIHLHQ